MIPINGTFEHNFDDGASWRLTVVRISPRRAIVAFVPPPGMGTTTTLTKKMPVKTANAVMTNIKNLMAEKGDNYRYWDAVPDVYQP